MLVFSEDDKAINIPIEVDSLLRERYDTDCDMGRNPLGIKKALIILFCYIFKRIKNVILIELAQEFPHLDFTAMSENWWENHPKNKKESKQHLDARIVSILAKWSSRPEKHIAVVGHSSFFKRVLKSRYKIGNCELKCIALSELQHNSTKRTK